MPNLYDLLMGRRPQPVPPPRPGYGLAGASISPMQKSPYERTLRPGETRNLAELQSMLGEVILAAGSGAVPGVQGKAPARQSAARIRPGSEGQFAKWFEGSKIKNEMGQPVTVYHGTRRDVKQFDSDFIGRNADAGYFGSGFYFSSSPETAALYAKKQGASGSNVLPAHLSIKRPFVIDWTTHEGATRTRTEAKKIGAELSWSGFASNAQDFKKALEKSGYDGVIVKREDEPLEYVVFSPSQIKSATGNRGTYDPKSPRIDE